MKCILPQLIKEAIFNSHVVRIKFSSLTVFTGGSWHMTGLCLFLVAIKTVDCLWTYQTLGHDKKDSWQRPHPHKTYQMTTIRTRLDSEWCPALCSLPWWGARCDIYRPFVVRKWPPGDIWQEPTPSTLPWSIDQNMSSRLLATIKINYTLISLHEVWHGASCRPQPDLPSNIPPQRPSAESVLIVVVTVNNLIIKWSRPAPNSGWSRCHVIIGVRPQALAWPGLCCQISSLSGAICGLKHQIESPYHYLIPGGS